jgi:diguanylate cyclase (GGDEF)-like protein
MTDQAGVRQRILIVDDQPTNVRVMAEVLRDGYELFFATNGARAMEIAETAGIDLILLDVVMPDLDGFEVCRRLKLNEQTERIPVIFVTAREESTDEARGFNVGGVDYITKPIQPLVVRARVQTHIELKRARDILESLATLDGLTGIANRRSFDRSLASEWERCRRAQQPLSIAIADVDHFKAFNDTYGHARGDDCLRAVANALQALARRPGDVVARYGGEEFGLIFPSTDGPAVMHLMRNLVMTVRDLGITSEQTGLGKVTVSAGAVTVSPWESLSVAHALETADQMLYDAKKSGRNRAGHMDLGSGARFWIE